MRTQEISLLDFLFEILVKWRMIFGVMIVGGVLLGGYSYIQSIQNIELQKSTDNLEDEKGVELTVMQKENVNLVLEYEKYAEYYDGLLLREIDITKVPTVELVYCVKVNDNKNKNVVVSTYSHLLAKGMVQWLIECGVDSNVAAQLGELMMVSNDNDVEQQTIEMSDRGTVYITIVHTDEKKCKKLAQCIKEYMLAQKAVVDATYGEHEVALVTETFAEVARKDLLDKQMGILAEATNYRMNIEAKIQEFSDAEKQCYSMLSGNPIVMDEKTDSEELNSVNQLPSINLKLVIIGMLVFAFLYVCFLFFMYLFNNKLRTTDSLAELYDITQLGVVSTVSGKKKFLGFIDNLIIKLRDRNKRKFTKEEAEEIVAVAIKMAVRKSETNEVSLIGCEVKKQTQDICNNIKALLEKEDITVTVLDNVLYNAEALEKLENTQNAVLVEKVGSTMYDEVAKEIELLQRNKINVLGGILVE